MCLGGICPTLNFCIHLVFLLLDIDWMSAFELKDTSRTIAQALPMIRLELASEQTNVQIGGHTNALFDMFKKFSKYLD